MHHGIVIPDSDMDEMMDFILEYDKDVEESPPAWIDWDSGAPLPHADPISDGETESITSGDESADDGRLPFLQLPKNPNGKLCKCGSDTHLTVQSFACPLNNRYRANNDDGSDDDGDSDSGDNDNDFDDDGSDGFGFLIFYCLSLSHSLLYYLLFM